MSYHYTANVPGSSCDLTAVGQALPHLRSLLTTSSDADLAAAVGTLADCSRQEAWREPIGSSGLLDFCLEVLNHPVIPDSHCHALRVIANSCADTDSNRDRIIANPLFHAIPEKLFVASSAHVALAALHNISLDYEPAQQFLRKKGICEVIIRFLCWSGFNPDAHLGQTCTILQFAFEDYDVHHSPDTILAALLCLSNYPGLSFSELVTVLRGVTVHLMIKSFQERLIEDFQADLLLGLIQRKSDFDTSLDPNNHGFMETKTENSISGDDVEQLEFSTDALLMILLDLSSLPKFAINYPYGSSLTLTLDSWLKSRSPNNRIAACSILSGLARADEKWARSMVSGSHGIHHDLIDMIASETNPRYFSIICDFLLQLARPVKNREFICQPAFLWVAAHHWSGNDRDVQYHITTVLRYLVRDCPSAVLSLLLSAPTTTPPFIAVDDRQHGSSIQAKQRFNECMFERQREVPISTHQQDPGTSEADNNSSSSVLNKRTARRHSPQDQPENPSQTGQPDKMAEPRDTYCSGMLKLYVASDDSMVKAEISRVVLEICRCIPLLDPSDRASFVQHKDFATPLISLVVGNGEPALRAQAYLAMVLMAQEPSGRPIVQTILKREDVLKQITRDIDADGINLAPGPSRATSEDMSVEQWNTILRSIRENATWLVKDAADRVGGDASKRH